MAVKFRGVAKKGPMGPSDLDCRIVSKKDFKTSFLGQEYLIP